VISFVDDWRERRWVVPDRHCVPYRRSSGRNDLSSTLPFDERESFAQEHGFEPQRHETYEWWVVTRYVSQRLAEFGEPILDNDFGTWWGRTCTGQSICLDHVIGRLLGDGLADG
jgi:hypothetical protein